MRRRATDLTWIAFVASAGLLLSPLRRVLFAAGWAGPLWAWAVIIAIACGLSWIWARRDD